ncbi:hypothetical protein CR513_20904, partial [Mucuna pruriens]
MPVTQNQAVSSLKSEEGALQRLMQVVANLQERSEKQTRLTDEVKKIHEEAEKRHKEELKRAANWEARLKKQLESLWGSEGHFDPPPPLDPCIHLQAFQTQVYISDGNDLLS